MGWQIRLFLEGRTAGKVPQLLPLLGALLFLRWASSLPKMPQLPGTDSVIKSME